MDSFKSTDNVLFITSDSNSMEEKNLLSSKVKSVELSTQNDVDGLVKTKGESFDGILSISNLPHKDQILVELAKILKPGSSVVICTDGMANVGLGSLENMVIQEEADKIEAFYNDAANFAKSNGVVVNIISIEGTNVNLEYIGKVPQLTNGFNDIVNPSKINKKFQLFIGKSYCRY